MNDISKKSLLSLTACHSHGKMFWFNQQCVSKEMINRYTQNICYSQIGR